MKHVRIGLVYGLLLAVTVGVIPGGLTPVARADSPSQRATQAAIPWQPWSDKVFEQAKAENKLVILDLEAVWCHWCHVMNDETYSNANVINALNKNYLAIRVDQDSRPDLSQRYMNYGWPATIIFKADGTELAKRAGFIEPADMKQLLTRLAANPTPESDDEGEAAVSQFSKSPFLSATQKASLEKQFLAEYDNKQGAWGIGDNKYLDWDSLDYALSQARQGDRKAQAMAKQSLTNASKLLDPVWGGFYQYSTDGIWTHPHFEKIMQMQTEEMRVYAEGYAQYRDPLYLKTAERIHDFLKNFLMGPEGAFYTSMDADLIPGKHSGEYFALNDAGRRKRGIPRIDKHQYARENGWAIHSLIALYTVTGKAEYLEEAQTAAKWVINNRALPEGGFSHDAKDAAGPYLGDTLAMGRAFLSLYQATGDRAWLTRSEQAADYIAKTFTNANGQPGFVSASSPPGAVLKYTPLRDENVMLARYANNLYHSSGQKRYRELATTAMRYVVTPEIAKMPYAGSVLLADSELSQDPLHITVVGPKDDAVSQSLFQAALRYPSIYKRVDWWDRSEGPMPNADVQYPDLPKPAAFVCTNKRCSLPVFQADALAPLVARLTAPKNAK